MFRRGLGNAVRRSRREIVALCCHRRRGRCVDEFTAMLKSEVGRWQKLAKDTNLKLD
jgi:hypothetical protein